VQGDAAGPVPGTVTVAQGVAERLAPDEVGVDAGLVVVHLHR